MNNQVRKTFHVYHHRNEPLKPHEITPETWLINNGVTYHKVASVEAPTAHEALVAMQEKQAGRGKRQRWVNLSVPFLERVTASGDVLVGEKQAWMITTEGDVSLLPYPITPAFLSLRPSYSSHEGATKSVSWSPDGNHLAAAANASGRVYLYTPFASEEHTTPFYPRHDNWTTFAVAWSPNGSRLASAGFQGEVHLWQPHPFGPYQRGARGSILICCPDNWMGGGGGESIHCVGWTPVGSHVIVGREDGSLISWESVTGKCVSFLSSYHERCITGLAFSPDGAWLATSSKDGTLRIRNQEGQQREDILCRHASAVLAFAWSPESHLLVTGCQHDASLRFWDLSGHRGEQVPLSVSFTDPLSVTSIAWSPDGHTLAVGCDDGTVQMVDVTLRRHIHTYRTRILHPICSVAWSPDGRFLAAGERESPSSYQGRIQIWQWEIPGSDNGISQA